MNAENRAFCKYLSGLSTADAANPLPRMLDGDPHQRSRFLVYWHRSWAKSNQRRLLEQLVGPGFFRSSRGYENVLKVTFIGRFLHFVLADLPKEHSKTELLLYNAHNPLAQRAKTCREKRLVLAFKDRLGRTRGTGP